MSGLFGPLGKNEIRVKADEPVTIDLPINGTSTSIIPWTIEGESIQATGEFVEWLVVFANLIFYSIWFIIQIENNDFHAKLHKPLSKRADTEKYKVQLKSDSGEDECDIDVIVLDKPGVLEEPLETTETTKDSVSLQWKSPKDNGGSGSGDITGIIKLLSKKNFLEINFFLKLYH